jgi:uncharacterized damage-inducible protein DinB
MKQYLLDFFKFNDWANRKVFESIAELPEKDEVVRLLGHIITAQDRWLNRVTKEVDDSAQSWAGPAIPLEELETRWSAGISKWLKLLENSDEAILENYIAFVRPSDSKSLKIKLRDIMLQLNYHSIGHRAQINRLIREQGHKPPQTDYIFTVLQEL